MKIETEEQLMAAIGANSGDKAGGASKSSLGIGIMAATGASGLSNFTKDLRIGETVFVKKERMDAVKNYCWHGMFFGSTTGVLLAAKEILFTDIGSKMSRKKLYVLGTGLPVAGLLIGTASGFLIGLCAEIIIPRFIAPITTLKDTGFDKQKISQAWKKRGEQYKEEASAILGLEKEKVEVEGDDY